jgi:DNA-binding IscR family transcriptional regulator
VLRAVEGGSAFEAAAQGRRNGGAGQELAELWDEISEAVSQVVDRVTFGDLVTRALERRRTAKPMYHI